MFCLTHGWIPTRFQKGLVPKGDSRGERVNTTHKHFSHAAGNTIQFNSKTLHKTLNGNFPVQHTWSD